MKPGPEPKDHTAIDPTLFDWPNAQLDPVEKMRILAAGLPHVAIAETVFETDFDRFWDFIANLEHSTPLYEGAVSRLRVLDRDEDRLRIESSLIPGLWTESKMVLRRGWCLMSSRWGNVGMAARAEGPGRTRFVHFEGVQHFRRLLRPLLRRNIEGDFKRLRSLLE